MLDKTIEKRKLTQRLGGFIYIRVIRPFIIHPLQKTFFWNLLRLIAAIVFEKCILIYLKIHRKIKNKQSVSKYPNEGKALMIYSKRHFNPDLSTNQIEHSASNLARNIYGLLKDSKGEITYLDQKDRKRFSGLGLIVSILSNSFVINCRKNPNAKKVLFLVNSHPIFKLKRLLKESMRTGIMFSQCEYVSPFIFLKSLLYTDTYILIGNDFVEKTFLERGIDGDKLYTINSGVNLEKIIPNKSLRSKKIRFLYSPGYIGLRKGLLVMLDLWDALEEEMQEHIELVIIGQTEKKDLLSRINRLVTKRKNVKFLGWIESSTRNYAELLQSSHSVILPSLEEGQVGSVLEAMCAGCVPIINENCGIGIQDKKEGYIIKDMFNRNEIESYIYEILTDREKYENMSMASRMYIETNHNWPQFRENFRNILNK